MSLMPADGGCFSVVCPLSTMIPGDQSDVSRLRDDVRRSGIRREHGSVKGIMRIPRTRLIRRDSHDAVTEDKL